MTKSAASLVAVLFLSAGSTVAATRTLLEWTFDRDGDLQGWQANAHLADVAVTNGALVCRAVGADPILELLPSLDLPASPWQMFEVRLKADRDGTAEVFWSNTTQGRYGGFSQEKSTRFNVVGDNQWRTYRLLPFWHPERKIVRLRFDVYDGATFAVDSIRITELDVPSAPGPADFVFTNAAHGWQVVGDGALQVGREGLRFTARARDAFLLGPPVRLAAERESFVTLRLATDAGRHATLLFATEDAPGLHRFTFPLERTAGEHIYNLDLLAATGWRGRIIALGLQPTDQPRAGVRLGWLKVGSTPQGPPQLKAKSLALEEALPRAGRSTQLKAVIANTGAETVTNLHATLCLPRGFAMSSDSATTATVDRLAFDEEAVLRWTIRADRPAVGTAVLTLAAANAEPAQVELPLVFTAKPNLPAVSYVPEPKPVRGAAEVGVYYFPGWKSRSQWQPIQSFPERRPVLGWYREGDPEVADWHIKWAVEHGITFFAYDWYWSQGARQLEHALHDEYFKARYRHLLKFCLLWANHNPPHTSSPEDCLAVTRYWIENYFCRPEHLTFDGKPVVIIFSPQRLTEDLGSAQVKRAFDAMRAECQRVGLKGLCLIACVGEAGGARQAAAEGYDAVTAYTWPGLGMTGEGQYAPYATLLDGYRRQWEHLVAQSPIPLAPLPVCSGWDSRPWHGENNLVRFGRTPALFKEHLLDARHFLETAKGRAPAANLLLVEAWNEWGEGSYIEPHQEFGFGYLDAIRDVFTDAPGGHVDLAPADAGLGPYELPPDPPGRTKWEFESGDEGWGTGMQLADLRATNGVLSALTSGNDPAFFAPAMQARAGEFRAVELRMRLTPGGGPAWRDSAQLFWRTSRLPEGEATSVRFHVTGDGQWREYRVPVADNPRWRGVITRLRFDPCNRAGVQLEVDWIRLAR